MKREDRNFVILLADDDEDDYLLIRDAIEGLSCVNISTHGGVNGEGYCVGNTIELQWVRNGEELMDYLLRHNDYTNPKEYPCPNIILLDLNMPKKDGRETLRDIKSNDDLTHIPVIVMTTSGANEDIKLTYKLGANSYIKKPMGFTQFQEVMNFLSIYWFSIVELPPKG